jgi:hypothetical protein
MHDQRCRWGNKRERKRPDVLTVRPAPSGSRRRRLVTSDAAVPAEGKGRAKGRASGLWVERLQRWAVKVAEA